MSHYMIDTSIKICLYVFNEMQEEGKNEKYSADTAAIFSFSCVYLKLEHQRALDSTSLVSIGSFLLN